MVFNINVSNDALATTLANQGTAVIAVLDVICLGRVASARGIFCISSISRQIRQMTKQARCKAESHQPDRYPEDSSDDEEDSTHQSKPYAAGPPSPRGANQTGPKATHQTPSYSRRRDTNAKERLHTQSYCTQACLLGLVRGSPLDPCCPNVDIHRRASVPQKHALDCTGLTQLLEQQL